jgi:hypothetical protein
MRDICCSAKQEALSGDFHNRDRGLRRDPAHPPPYVMVKDYVPYHKDVHVFKAAYDLFVIHCLLI